MKHHSLMSAMTFNRNRVKLVSVHSLIGLKIVRGERGGGGGSELNASHILIHCTSCFCFLLPYIVVPWVFSIAKYCCETVSYFSRFLPFLLLSPVDLPPPLFPGSHPLSPHHIIIYTYCPIPCACTYMRTYATHQHSSPSSI